MQLKRHDCNISLALSTRGTYVFPGRLKVETYKTGKPWAEDSVETTGNAARLAGEADRNIIKADGNDLSLITIRIADAKGLTVPVANNIISFSVEGPG